MTTSEPTASESAEAPPFTHPGFWAVVAVIGHAPGLWIGGRFFSFLARGPIAPRLGMATLRLNFVAISTTLVVTAAIAVAGHALWAVIAFGIGHTIWSFTLAARILSGAVLK